LREKRNVQTKTKPDFSQLYRAFYRRGKLNVLGVAKKKIASGKPTVPKQFQTGQRQRIRIAVIRD